MGGSSAGSVAGGSNSWTKFGVHGGTVCTVESNWVSTRVLMRMGSTPAKATSPLLPLVSTAPGASAT